MSTALIVSHVSLAPAWPDPYSRPKVPEGGPGLCLVPVSRRRLGGLRRLEMLFSSLYGQLSDGERGLLEFVVSAPDALFVGEGAFLARLGEEALWGAWNDWKSGQRCSPALLAGELAVKAAGAARGLTREGYHNAVLRVSDAGCSWSAWSAWGELSSGLVNAEDFLEEWDRLGGAEVAQARHEVLREFGQVYYTRGPAEGGFRYECGTSVYLKGVDWLELARACRLLELWSGPGPAGPGLTAGDARLLGHLLAVVNQVRDAFARDEGLPVVYSAPEGEFGR